MNSERNIVNRMFEGKYQELEESSFKSRGNVYSCAFGRYTRNGDPITRDEYFKAKENPDRGNPDDRSVDLYIKLKALSDKYGVDEKALETLLLNGAISQDVINSL